VTKPSAFRATFADLKVIKTRQCVQIILEVPTEQFDAAYEVLGGLPNPAAERWFAVAALAQDSKPASERSQAVVLDKPQSGGKRDWRICRRRNRPRSVATTSCLRLSSKRSDLTIGTRPAQIRRNASVSSAALRRGALLNTEHRARVVWKQLDDQFQAWERVGA
jgi:hypothetical protein